MARLVWHGGHVSVAQIALAVAVVHERKALAHVLVAQRLALPQRVHISKGAPHATASDAVRTKVAVAQTHKGRGHHLGRHLRPPARGDMIALLIAVQAVAMTRAAATPAAAATSAAALLLAAAATPAAALLFAASSLLFAASSPSPPRSLAPAHGELVVFAFRHVRVQITKRWRWVSSPIHIPGVHPDPHVCAVLDAGSHRTRLMHHPIVVARGLCRPDVRPRGQASQPWLDRRLARQVGESRLAATPDVIEVHEGSQHAVTHGLPSKRSVITVVVAPEKLACRVLDELDGLIVGAADSCRVLELVQDALDGRVLEAIGMAPSV